MALSHVLELNSGPAVVPQLGYVTPLVSPVSVMRCTQLVATQVAQGGVPAALPTGAALFLGVKLPGAIKGDWLAQTQLTAATGDGTTGQWTGTLALNTPEMVTAMHGDPSDPVAELLTLPCLAEYYYTVPGQTDPICALNFNLTVSAPLYSGTEGQAPSANPQWPTPTAVTTAIAQAAAADTPAARNTAIAAAVAGLPAPVNTSAAPIQPFSAWLSNASWLSRISGGYSGITLPLSAIGATYISPAEVANWLVQAVYFIQPNLGSAPITVDLSDNALSNTTAILAALAAAVGQAPLTNFSGSNLTILLQGGTNVEPTPATPHQTASGIYTFTGTLPSIETSGVSVYGGGGSGSPTNPLGSIVLDATIAFSASSAGANAITIGVSDTPSPVQIAAEVASLFSSGGFDVPDSVTDNGNGSITITESQDQNLPLAMGPNNNLNIATFSGTNGQPPVPDADITTLQTYGATVTTN